MMLEVIKQVLAAVIGTISFAVLFGSPRKYYWFCGVIGGIGWIVYLLFDQYGAVAASFAATIAVVFLSRLVAIHKRCPVTVFLIAGIFPLVPGSYVYWTAHYLVMNQVDLAAEKGYMAIKIAIAIVLGIVFVFEIPQKVFSALVISDKEYKRKTR